jgi:hypothetical protein
VFEYSVIFVWKSEGLELVIITLTLSERRTGMEMLPKTLDKSFIFIIKGEGPRM